MTSVSYSYLINGAAQGRVHPSRGIRQGYPLSPYLFILCMEVLSGLCKRAQRSGKVVGVKVATNSPAINHLLFADDTMFFSRTDARSCDELNAILKKYEEASGQFINLESQLLPSLLRPREKSNGGLSHSFRSSMREALEITEVSRSILVEKSAIFSHL